MINFFILSAGKHKKWPLQRGKYTIGRSPQCELIIEDETVSRKHAQLDVIDEQTINLTDLGSHNGTAVDGHRIDGTVQIQLDDIITFGGIEAKISRDEFSDILHSSVHITDSVDGLVNVTRLPIKEALQPLPSKILENPKLFKAFSELGKMLILSGPAEEMYGQALELFKDLIPVERIAIFSAEEQKEEIAVAASYTSDRRHSDSFNISRTVVHELLNQKNALLLSDIQRDRKFAAQKSIIESRIKSAMAVPLFDEDKITGILYADTTNPMHHYNEDHLRVMATFGNILGAKIANCNLLKERQAKQVLESELETASQIQEQLLPKELPHLANYSFHAFQIQCKQVGGDLYDIAKFEDGRILFLVADVCGKGMGAALLASNILAGFRILHNAKDFHPLDAVRRMSKQLLTFSRPGDFATLFIGVLDPSAHTFRYVNAGHNPPLILRDAGSVDYLESSGVPIGMLDHDIWKEESLEFGTGDYLFIFTDGIPEAINCQDEQFSDERLEEFVQQCRNQSPKELTELVMNEVRKFIGDVPRSDDITMVVLHREK